MYNHRNGDFFNTVTNTVHGKHLTVEARRNIKAGEQIHNSYNKCKECMGRRVGYGTAGKKNVELGEHCTITRETGL